MLKRFAFFLFSVFVVIALNSFVTEIDVLDKGEVQQENHPPVVKIVTPKDNTAYTWNTPVRYKIKVSDQEDGESTLQEIPSNEVFLQVRYVADVSKAIDEIKQADKTEPIGLTAIKASNCLNCHAFAGKLIGPSFYDISKRYSDTKSNLDLLAKRVREGSAGVWGNVTMPTHPEITQEETQEMVKWILKNGAEPDVTYYRGTEGFFTLKPTGGTESIGAFVLTASYADHGLKDKPKQSLRGYDVAVIQMK